LLINDRVDVALACGAHGVQLGARGLRAADARRLLGDRSLLGVSVHSSEEADAAAGADFLLVGTLFPTASHPERKGAGTQLLRRLANLALSQIGIGGITTERVAEVRRAGAAGIAVLSGVWQAEEPGRAVEEYLRAWKEGE
ncbi:MAG TPA: thiamine phosphate synthase, partial [Longimicrobiaceae bacterium]|nr:thiamine phosphate synthase [Longimicrobiaceae bacterium]